MSARGGVVAQRSWVRRNPAATAAIVGALLLVAALSGLMGLVSLAVVIGPAGPGEPTSAALEASAPAPSPVAGTTGPTAPPSPDPGPGPTPPSTPSPEPAPAPPAPEESGASPQTALAAVGLLEVKGRAPKTGYSRDLFGSGWVDVDRNGCDTRNDMLARDLTAVTYRPGTHDCVVLTGTLADPYSGTVVAFQRGNTTSTAVQIDHVVALSDAWQKGAQQWDEETRTVFANAPLNLLAVDGGLNQQKGDGDTATWLPPNKPFRCAYVARQVAVKHAFGLWVTAAERDAMVRALGDCPQEPLPTAAAAAPAASPPLGNPGTAKSCGDFATWPEAQAWFDLYYPAFGDVAGLDVDGDLTACETLPGR